TLFRPLLILQAPPADCRQRCGSQIAVGVSQMLVAAEDFLPGAAVLFDHHRARYKDARNGVLRRRLQPIDQQGLLSSRSGQVAEDKHVGIGAEHALRYLLDLRWNRWG